MEGTGSYGAGLCRMLLDAAYDVVEVNRPDRAARRRRGKDDPVDAEAAARSFLAGTATIVPKRGGDQVEMIRLLKVALDRRSSAQRWDSAIDGRTRALNQVRSLLVTAPVALRERLKGLSSSELIVTCASFRPGVLAGPMAAAKRALRSLARRIQALDAELDSLMSDLDALTQAACPGLRQSYGIGVDGAAVLLAAVGDNPERIRSEAAFAAICGASPLEASSGNRRHHRLNRGGNRQANATLHRIAVVRLRWHEQTKAYAARRKAEGLSNKDIPAMPQAVHRPGGVPSADGQATQANSGQMRHGLSMAQAPIRSDDRHHKRSSDRMDQSRPLQQRTAAKTEGRGT